MIQFDLVFAFFITERGNFEGITSVFGDNQKRAQAYEIF